MSEKKESSSEFTKRGNYLLKTVIGLAIMSAMCPDHSFGDKRIAVELSRSINEAGAEIVQRYPKRLGFVACLPLPDVEATLEEIRYAFDVLHADGIRLLSNSCGVYPGDPATDAVYAELNRRKAVIVLHPTRPVDLPPNVVTSISVPLFEFFTETTRALLNLICSGTLNRYPDLKVIVPHSGATFVPLAERFQALYSRLCTMREGLQPVDIIAAAKKCYFDLAGDPLPRQMDTLLTFADPTHVLYGSDFPFGSPQKEIADITRLQNYEPISQYREMFLGDNAKALFPRFY